MGTHASPAPEEPTHQLNPACVSVCPTAQSLIEEANERLLEISAARYDFVGDEALVELAFPDWHVVAYTSLHAPGFGQPRMLLRHRTHQWWILIHPNRRAFRLLMAREWEPSPFQFTTDDENGVTLTAGTLDDIYDVAVALQRRMTWSPDVLAWFFTHMPGERAEAEKVLLGFWYTEMQQPRTRRRA